MSHRLRAAHLALLLVALSAPAAASSGFLQGPVSPQLTQTPADPPPVNQTTIHVQLQSNSDARWIVRTQFDVSTEQERASFNTTADQFEDGSTDALGLSAFERANDEASSATGRAMNVTDVERSSDRVNGSLTLSFTWTNFARQESDVLYVDDVFNTSDGSWFNSLESDQRLIIELPTDAGVRSAPKRVQNGRITWDGPQQFSGSELHLAYSQGVTTTRPPTTDPDSTTSPSPDGNVTSPTDPDDSNAILWGGFFAVGLGIAVVSVYMLSRREDEPPSDDGVDDGESPDSPGGGPTPAVAAGASGASTAAVTQETEEVDEELLSDEERVERLLTQNGGRMKQANIVKETGWSNAKVSQLLSAMEEDGHIDKLRIGRENLISFPDEDVTDIED